MKQLCTNCTNKADYIYKDVFYCYSCYTALIHRPTTMIEFKRNRNVIGELINE